MVEFSSHQESQPVSAAVVGVTCVSCMSPLPSTTPPPPPPPLHHPGPSQAPGSASSGEEQRSVGVVLLYCNTPLLIMPSAPSLALVNENTSLKTELAELRGLCVCA